MTPDDRYAGARYPRLPYQIAKRAFDIVVSLVAILLLSPVFIAIAIAIALSDGFPVLFKHKRVGLNGRLFDIYKFRTMVRNAEEVLKKDPELWKQFQENYKIERDPRIMKIGHFLRKSSLDELPQLFNVLKGDMSLVGPRPIVEPELEKYGEHQDIYLAMKPGCAGVWQASGRSDTTYAERVEFDRQYYMKAGLRYDVATLFKTTWSMLVGRGAR
ncbi:MAG TPA: sugar transferase [Fimbriimonadaceae bacterium]|nr:sugar transferase [Fimbriimonadaceae bacterium]HRJ97004.1 sugar transferase [Fimbriimonadaceae bacterium]